ncbi:type IV pilus biogenesis protein PilM [Pseudomonas siliginis]|uniref:type IV pilus biogenesis protein PilM n=1 Tax=Pseudomonas siliginis TaxID=2842346 RepID=UPI0020931AFE|nr:type IV pilus biogenesis protein PilM [Pseudomonas siliginis]UST77170.1 type IV pilus biogenesis protein PilM [Pseudomonas siliginis]
MPLIWILLVALLFGGYMQSENEKSSEVLSAESENETIAGNMQVYKNALVRYIELNPSANGSIPDSSLTLPSWFTRRPGVANYVSAGKVYVYYEARPELASVILRDTETMGVGINNNGILIHPRSGNTGIQIPAQIPTTSVVLMQ